ncbi:hypothetical protein BaRGS_00010956 [Batillaria attramentaria]|uniref:Guanylate cyclase n=1 Tax=Batillaria attramentaria TaxID=370345 RepID=A0ABD0LE36_9CAEN
MTCVRVPCLSAAAAIILLTVHNVVVMVVAVQADNEVRLGVILPKEGDNPWVIQKTVPAIKYAVETIAKDRILPRHRLVINEADSKCSQTTAPLAAIDMYINRTAHVFLGPACNYAIAPVARFSYKWKIPVLTSGALVRAFQDKTEYQLLTRMLGSYDKCAEIVLAICDKFRWKKIGLLFHNKKGANQGRSECYFSVEGIYQGVTARFNSTQPWHKQFDERTEKNFKEFLLEASRNARIIVLCASPDSVREIMIQAHDLNFDNGEYVFFNIDLFNSHNMTERPWYRENDSASRNEAARQAYEALMTVTLRKPTSPEYKKFSEEVKRRAEKAYTNFTYGEDEVNSFVGAFHDAVILYALALNETLEAGGSVRDGVDINRRMWNRTFQGITGTVSIDANGDRNADYSLLDLNPSKDKFEKYEAVENKKIYWAGGKSEPPPDEPECGFDGSKCPPDKPFPEYAIVIIVLGSLLLVVLVITLIVYRHLRLEAELASMNWRVRWEDILFGNPAKNLSLENRCCSAVVGQGYDKASSGGAAIPGDTIAEVNRQLFTKTCYYKGAILSIKSISRQHISITKPLLVEIKRIKDLQNDHLVRFHGICIDPPHQCILTEYCPKGSLQDVLENEQIKLDWMFRYSIMQDIVRGMSYLQSTEIRSHGNLKSTNCVVDSRFVVKITDFGLQYFREKEEEIEDDSYAHFRRRHRQSRVALKKPPGQRNKGGYSCERGKRVSVPVEFPEWFCVVSVVSVCPKYLTTSSPTRVSQDLRNEVNDAQVPSYQLWTAPELLRLEHRPPAGSVKGDVYSFAIICQEIVYRRGVFHLHNIDIGPAEIVEKVRGGLKPYFRPTLENFDCPCDELAVLIRRCWAEDPNERPDFQALRTLIKRLNKDGDKGDILDNLLSRMEQYANNLEALVEERTSDYLEQKRRAEELLYSMLPKQIAVQLTRGEVVKAETFENVTIYFSDICGFTALSAESTPMQVVDLLNDLYTTFDSIIDNYDVYKVETIGDAYMVVSGLPIRNGILHAREIARMSLSLLNAVFTFKIRHRPKDQLRLRIGSACAGVVGQKMPRYCLFGDTVNTASRMESNGLPLKIHVSPQTKEVLDTFGTFQMELRGEVEMKGKGCVTTYWLNGEVGGMSVVR